MVSILAPYFWFGWSFNPTGVFSLHRRLRCCVLACVLWPNRCQKWTTFLQGQFVNINSINFLWGQHHSATMMRRVLLAFKADCAIRLLNHLRFYHCVCIYTYNQIRMDCFRKSSSCDQANVPKMQNNEQKRGKELGIEILPNFPY